MSEIENTVEKDRFAAKEKFLLLLSRYLSDNKDAFINAESFDKVNELCAFSKAYWRILFEKGARQIAAAIEELEDDHMLKTLLAMETKPEKIREKIALALNMRIIDPQRKELKLKLSSFFLSPENLASGLKAAAKTCDIIWRYAGDKSTDFNYYTKRGLLLSVYMKARTFYFADNSDSNFKTKEYIKEALDNVIKIGGIKRNIKQKMENVSKGLAEKNPLGKTSLLKRIRFPKIEDIPILRFFL